MADTNEVKYASGNTSLPSHARVVIIGGGVVGCSVAYHLAELGWIDIVVLLERKNSDLRDNLACRWTYCPTAGYPEYDKAC